MSETDDRLTGSTHQNRGADSVFDMAIAALAHLGQGADGPWENRTHRVVEARLAGRIRYPVVRAWVNATYSVQLLNHHGTTPHDHLIVRRHDEGVDIPWADLQQIKDRLTSDGQFRWAYEAFPPKLALVDNHNLRHVWVMPQGWKPPVDLRDVKT